MPLVHVIARIPRAHTRVCQHTKTNKTQVKLCVCGGWGGGGASPSCVYVLHSVVTFDEERSNVWIAVLPW